MEGRRFAVGLAAGLLFALAIVAGSGLNSGLSGSLTKSGGAQVVITSGTTTSQAVTTSVPTFVAGLQVTTSTTSGNILSSSISPTGQNGSYSTNGQTAGTAAGSLFSSDLAAANQLPSSSRALLLAPIAVAALLGVLIYRASSRDRVEPEED